MLMNVTERERRVSLSLDRLNISLFFSCPLVIITSSCDTQSVITYCRKIHHQTRIPSLSIIEVQSIIINRRTFHHMDHSVNVNKHTSVIMLSPSSSRIKHSVPSSSSVRHRQSQNIPSSGTVNHRTFHHPAWQNITSSGMVNHRTFRHPAWSITEHSVIKLCPSSPITEHSLIRLSPSISMPEHPFNSLINKRFH